MVTIFETIIIDEVDLTLVLQGSPNPSDPVEVAKLENKKYGLTLALDLTELADPKLIALSDVSVYYRETIIYIHTLQVPLLLCMHKSIIYIHALQVPLLLCMHKSIYIRTLQVPLLLCMHKSIYIRTLQVPLLLCMHKSIYIRTLQVSQLFACTSLYTYTADFFVICTLKLKM